jgi:hypothetical protein
MFLPYAVEDNIERKKTELDVVLNESLNNINKGNGNKVSSVGITKTQKINLCIGLILKCI